MSYAYLLPGNRSYRAIESIPVDAKNHFNQAATGTDTATKDQNLNTQLYDGVGDPISSTVRTTVSQVVAPILDINGNSIGGTYADGSPVPVPAYRVTVSGWTTDAVDPTGLGLVGGFPRSPNRDQMVDPTNTQLQIRPNGTVQLYSSTLLNTPQTPLVYVLPAESTIVDLWDKADGKAFPYWEINFGAEISSAQTTARIAHFEFSFDLPLLKPAMIAQ